MFSIICSNHFVSCLYYTFLQTIVVSSPGSVNVDFVASFNDTTEVTNEMIQTEMVNAMNVSNNGTFLGDLQVSESTNLTEVANEISVEGKCVILLFYFNKIESIIEQTKFLADLFVNKRPEKSILLFIITYIFHFPS